MLYNRNDYMDPLRIFTGDHQYSPRVKSFKISWKPPALNWLKWSTDASRIAAKKSTTIAYVCRDDKGQIVHNMCKLIRGVPLLVAEAVAIREALRTACHLNLEIYS